MSIKIDRLNNLFLEEISKILRTEIKDERISFVTITDVNITNDLSFAKVYFTCFNEDSKVGICYDTYVIFLTAYTKSSLLKFSKLFFILYAQIGYIKIIYIPL